jgi:hypothetical protein
MKLPKSETIILLAFLVCIALWAISKCSESRADAIRKVRQSEDTEQEDRPVRRDTVAVQTAPQKPSNETPATQNPVPPPSLAPQTQPGVSRPGAIPKRPSNNPDPAPAAKSTDANGSMLYATIDGLKVRKEPGLKGETLAELALYEPVTFLNKKTEWTQEISLGYEKVTDHWVKVRTRSGKEGWVFGAGVHYYKMKRQGVLETPKTQETAPKKKN